MISKVVSIGKILKPTGLAGFNKFKRYTSSNVFFKKNRTVMVAAEEVKWRRLNLDGLPTETLNNQTFYIFTIQDLNERSMSIRLETIKDRTDAEQLTNVELYVDRAMLPETREDEYYHVDLLECQAFNQDDIIVGTVADVFNYGGGDGLEIKLNQYYARSRNINKATCTIGINKSSITNIDIRSKKIIIDDNFLLW